MKKIFILIIRIIVSSQFVFAQCPSSVTDIDGNSYDVIQIGNQCWMGSDLRVTKYMNGISILDGTGIGAATLGGNWSQSTYYFNYNDSLQYVNSFGRLYTWYAAMNGSSSTNSSPSNVQGVCPDGWHLPSISEWDTLFKYIDTNADLTLNQGFALSVSTFAGGMLKDTSSNYWFTPNVGASNSYGFNARGGGFRDPSGVFSSLNSGAQYLSTTEWSQYKMYTVLIRHYTSELFTYGNTNKVTGHSVRCICNNTATYNSTLNYNSQVTVYPNPTNGQITIQLFKSTTSGMIQVLSSTNDLILETNLKEIENTISLPPSIKSGLYFIIYYDEHKMIVKVTKLMVIK